ncbi:MAG: amidohydrolase family protein [Arcanobacterium sp.]|nr:amidohydrolase family protein [Arcanobacterium sp.]
MVDHYQGAIDTHAHIYPARYLDMLEEIGVDPQTTQIARNLHADSTYDDMQRRIEWMNKAGVATQILAVTPQIPSAPEATRSLDAARWINDHYAGVVGDYPGRFLAYGALPLPHIPESLAEIDRIFDELHFVGIGLPTFLPGGQSLTDKVLEPVWEALNERHAIVNIHATGAGAYSKQITDFWLTWVNGAPIEDAIAVLQLLKRGIPQRYPNIRFHIAHLAGDLAFMWQRLEDNYTDWNSFPSSPNEAIRKMWFDAANFTEPALALAAEVYGASQIMGGSDMPYFQEELYVRAFDYIRSSRLSEADKHAILTDNARRLFGMD